MIFLLLVSLMAVVTISVPDEMKKKMDGFEEMNWSAVARRAFEESLRDMEIIREFRKKSKLTEEDAIELGKKVNASLAKRLGYT